MELPLAAQTLYFQLCMHADDEGFLNNVKKIQRSLAFSGDDLDEQKIKELNDGFKRLVDAGFILTFESGVAVIAHWKVHNSIRADRLEETSLPERKLVRLNDSKIYEYVENKASASMSDKCQSTDSQVTDKCQTSDSQATDICLTSDGQVTANPSRSCPHSIDKDSIGKDSLDKDREAKNNNINSSLNYFPLGNERDIRNEPKLSTFSTDDWMPSAESLKKPIPIRREGYS